MSDEDDGKKIIPCYSYVLGGSAFDRGKYRLKLRSDEEKNFDKISNHRYSENNMFDGKNFTYITND